MDEDICLFPYALLRRAGKTDCCGLLAEGAKHSSCVCVCVCVNGLDSSGTARVWVVSMQSCRVSLSGAEHISSDITTSYSIDNLINTAHKCLLCDNL